MRTTNALRTLPLALLAFAAGCSASSNPVASDEAGPTAGDSSRGEGDTTVAPGDASKPDHGGDSTDGGSPEDDTGAPLGDDAASPGDDAGSPATDASGKDGAGPLDAGGTGGEDAGPDVVVPPPPVDSGGGGGGPGHVVFLYPTSPSHWSSIGAALGAARVDLETKLNAVSSGADQWASLSRDGAWLAIVGTRFNCGSGSCLAVASGDGSTAAPVVVGGNPVIAKGRPAIASGGAIVVFPSTGGPHQTDLFVTVKSGGAWSAPRLLTAGSPAAYQHDVALSYDGARAIFVCGPSPYQVGGSSICETNVDGSGTRVVVANNAGPGATSSSMTHHPDYAPDGSVVFEADWQGTEMIWRARGSTFTQVSPANETDDNSPCVLPDGRIASLWLGRPGNTGAYHELKIMNADGSGTQMIVTGVDIVDVGQSCGH